MLKGKPASDAQINYARAISEELGTDMPSGDAYEFWKYINAYADIYKRFKAAVSDECFQNRFIPVHKGAPRGWELKGLNGVSGVYAFTSSDGEVLYVGKSVNLASRIPSSYAERSQQVRIDRILYYPCDNVSDVGILELVLIAENSPRLNSDSNHGVAPERFSSGLNILRDFVELPLVDGLVNEEDIVNLRDELVMRIRMSMQAEINDALAAIEEKERRRARDRERRARALRKTLREEIMREYGIEDARLMPEKAVSQ